ncbi:response regulator [Maridesulfovibrio bastinii]|uniref:response regulator n=1 Tax=Maridesulfovibrio bastinii TaxID=47157 RepID=UPI00041669BB|nr:response regulator [Maridesulfovibrio bastinii]
MTDIKKILFIDDEVDQLKSMRVLLHRKRKEWETHFISDGNEALELLNKEKFDMVVTDLRMPEVTGYEVLSQIKKIQPGAIRFVLSGYSDPNQILRAAKDAHQFLSKPCSPEHLTESIERSLKLQKIILNENVAHAIASLDELPTLPELYIQLEKELKCEDASVNRIGELIGSDPAMTASIMKIVNSSFFGIYSKVSSPVKAVTLLGLNTIKGLVLGVHLFGRVEDVHKDFSIQLLGEHCQFTALLAREIVNMEEGGREMAEQAFLAGFLHDLGKLILFAAFPEKYEKVLNLLNHEQISTCDAESQIMGFSHAEVGAYLLALWGFDVPVVEAVYSHHDPSRLMSFEFSPGVAVHIANSFEHELRTKHQDYNPHLLAAQWLEEGEYAIKLPRMLEKCAAKIDQDSE